MLSTLENMPFGPDSVYEFTGKGFLFVDDGKLRYKDIYDEGKDYAVELSSPNVALAGSSSITAVYNDTAMQIVGAEFPIEFSGRVLEVRCGSGYAAVLKQDDQKSYSLQVFDKSGSQVDQITFNDSSPMDFGFYGSDSEILWTISIETSGSEPTSTITTYDMSKSATTGVINIQSHLIERPMYSGKSLFVSTTNNLLRFDPVQNNESWRLKTYGWRLTDCFPSERPCFMLVPRNAAALSTVKLYSVDEKEMANETETIVHLPINTLGAYLCSNKLIAVTPAEILTYSFDGRAGESYPLDMIIEKAAKVDDSHIMLQSSGRLYIVTVK